MTFQISTRWPISILLILTALFLCANFSQSFAATSADKSTVTATPSRVQADGSSVATLTVTLRDNSNAPVTGKTVSVTPGSGSSSVSVASGVSDANGQVTFTVTNTKVESVDYTAKSVTDSVTLNQTADVSFTTVTSLEAQKANAAKNNLSAAVKALRGRVTNSAILGGSSHILDASIPRDILKKKEFKDAMDELALIDVCIRDSNTVTTTWDFWDNWNLGPAVSAQLLRYDTKNGKAALNAMGLGVGLSARYYSNDNIDPAALVKDSAGKAVRSIRRVDPDCRLSTFQLNETKKSEGKLYAKSMYSLGLFAFATKEADKDVLQVDPAFTVGFLQDLLTVGVGVDTQGRNRGHVFLLLGLGSAFDL